MKITLNGSNKKQVTNNMTKLLRLTLVLSISLIFQLLPITFAAETSLFETEDEFLNVDKAFILSSDLLDDEFIIKWQVADAYYLYKHRFSFSASGADSTSCRSGVHEIKK